MMVYLGEKKLANFRDRGVKTHDNSDKIKTRPGMSEDHLKLIRQLPCSVPGCVHKAKIDPHHLKSGPAKSSRGMGLTALDRFTVPLCRIDHDDVERAGSGSEERWFAARGLDSHLLAHDLWVNTGDLARMMRVLQAHQEVRS